LRPVSVPLRVRVRLRLYSPPVGFRVASIMTASSSAINLEMSSESVMMVVFTDEGR
jgi:hypothetical protein